MQEPIPGTPAPDATAGFGPAGMLLLRLAKLMAIAGGLVFVALVVMSIVSIVGRKLASAPVPGDVELLQMCAAFASAAFFAYCHLNAGDVKVDFFTHNLAPSKVQLARRHRLAAGRPVRRADRVAHRRRRAVGARGRARPR